MERILTIREKIKEFTSVDPSKSSVKYREYLSRISKLQEIDIMLSELENLNLTEDDLNEILTHLEKKTSELTEW